jgi:hypothetical protein
MQKEIIQTFISINEEDFCVNPEMLWTVKLMQSFFVLRIWKDIEEGRYNKHEKGISPKKLIHNSKYSIYT